MVKWLVKMGLKFVSYDTLVNTIACGIAYLLEYARTNSSKDGWEKAKKSVNGIKLWIDLFNQVYEDDNLSDEEEKLIQTAISNCTATESIYNLLQGKPNGTPIKKDTENEKV